MVNDRDCSYDGPGCQDDFAVEWIFGWIPPQENVVNANYCVMAVLSHWLEFSRMWNLMSI